MLQGSPEFGLMRKTLKQLLHMLNELNKDIETWIGGYTWHTWICQSWHVDSSLGMVYDFRQNSSFYPMTTPRWGETWGLLEYTFLTIRKIITSILKVELDHISSRHKTISIHRL